MLRMLFVCCDEGIPWESRLVLALKILCGFSTAEIALRLFTSEANVHKRLGRARERLRQAPPDVETPTLEKRRCRLPGVHGVLYLLFNEGYLSAHPEQAIRRELCHEALRLATLARVTLLICQATYLRTGTKIGPICPALLAGFEMREMVRLNLLLDSSRE
jgi:RNA polymerase sigma-70 factor (ECF subfamily)